MVRGNGQSSSSSVRLSSTSFPSPSAGSAPSPASSCLASPCSGVPAVFPSSEQRASGGTVNKSKDCSVPRGIQPNWEDGCGLCVVNSYVKVC